jgi:hypothetical protein
MFQLEDMLTVSEDGQTWSGSIDHNRIVMRDAANNVIVDLMVPPDVLSVTATRVGPTIESVVLPVVTPAAATPAP